MIYSENRTPTIDEFKSLMVRTDELLNREAVGNESYYSNRNGTQLESDVYNALTRTAAGTSFENTIRLVSGASFPDIVADGYYGVEVKSTKENKWKSIGSSILESTRIPGVEKIYLTFGKLGAPVRFMSRPYEECLSGVSVTHYPRYQIDMELRPGETIFDKINIPYDELRRMDNPVKPISNYYKSQLAPGQSLRWASDYIESTAVSPILRMWSTISATEKRDFTASALAFFPDVFGSKYENYTLWLITTASVVNPNVRDQFSAGGQFTYTIDSVGQTYSGLPAVVRRVQENKNSILNLINVADGDYLKERWGVDELSEDRIAQWSDITARQISCGLPQETKTAILYSILTD